MRGKAAQDSDRIAGIESLFWWSPSGPKRSSRVVDVVALVEAAVLVVRAPVADDARDIPLDQSLPDVSGEVTGIQTCQPLESGALARAIRVAPDRGLAVMGRWQA